jgi:hypothetical protein
VPLTSGQSVTAKNFGNTQKVSIAGTLFNDLDGDGVKDSGEGALSNWRVFLDADKDGVFDSTERSVLTNSSGAYTFNGLSAGSYRVREVLPAAAGGDDAVERFFDLTLASGATATARTSQYAENPHQRHRLQ